MPRKLHATVSAGIKAVLHALREEKLVTTRVGSVVLLDAERLREELSASY